MSEQHNTLRMAGPDQLVDGRLPFLHPDEKLYCARCGRRCEPLGHMFNRFLLCPVHGEFTIAPVVMEETTGWYIHFDDYQEASMWATCQAVDSRFPEGAPDGTTRVRGLVPDGEVPE